MAAHLTLSDVAVNFKLNNGATTSGAIRTVNLPIGGSSSRTISVSEFSADESAFVAKVEAIAVAASPILSKTVYFVQVVEQSRVEN